MVVRQRNLAMQRTAAVFIHLNAAFNQVVVQQVGAKLNNRNIRLALDNQLHPYAAPRGIAHRVQQTVAGKEIGVGDDDLAAGAGQHFQIVTFNIVTMFMVIAPDKQRLRFARGLVNFRLMPTASPPAAGCLAGGQVLQFEL